MRERTTERLISIVFAVNTNFLRHAAVGIASILHAHPHQRLDFRVITTGADRGRAEPPANRLLISRLRRSAFSIVSVSIWTSFS